MSLQRIIKKYPNRRLYDCAESRYVTLANIRQLVLDRVEVMITDHVTRKDITCQILLQVMLEQEQAGEPILSQETLARMIRSRALSAKVSSQIVIDGPPPH